MNNIKENNKIKLTEEEKKIKKSEYKRKWYIDNRKKVLLYNKNWELNNKEKLKQSRSNPKFKLKVKERMKKWRLQNKEIIKNYKKEYQNKKYKNDCYYKIIINLRNRFNLAIKNNFKSAKIKELIGCTIQEAKQHIESQFKEGMTWENHCIKGWHIDHIKPCASFDLSDPKQQRQCFHYSNLQPLWWWENLSKRDKIT